jgi:processive 1,2-diacylglycerol beta-glucosyltransferase
MLMPEEAAILVVSASAGMGQVRAGEAVTAALANGVVRAEHVDVLSLAPRWVGRAYGGGFELLASRAPRLWREIYERSDGPTEDAARWGPVAARVLFRSFRRLLRSHPWRLCLCTHFLPSQLMSGRPGAPPFALVVTDYSLHRYWVQPRVREYFVATRAMAAELTRRNAGAHALATGIPIEPAFARPPAWQDARARLGLDPDRPVALVMGGGAGMGVEEVVAAALAAPVRGLQVVAACGRNSAAHDRLLASADGSRLRVLGYRRDMPDVMTAADVVVTKPGGLTTTEALALGRPIVLTRPIPGHEEANVDVLTGAGAALFAPDSRSLVEALTTFFQQPALRLRLAQHARTMGEPDAARRIARAVLDHHAARAAA